MNANVSSDHLISPIPLFFQSYTHTVHTHTFLSPKHRIALSPASASILFHQLHFLLTIPLFHSLAFLNTFTILHDSGRESLPLVPLATFDRRNRWTERHLPSCFAVPPSKPVLNTYTHFMDSHFMQDAMSCNPFTTVSLFMSAGSTTIFTGRKREATYGERIMSVGGR